MPHWTLRIGSSPSPHPAGRCIRSRAAPKRAGALPQAKWGICSETVSDRDMLASNRRDRPGQATVRASLRATPITVYAASFGIARSTNRRNRELRAPATTPFRATTAASAILYGGSRFIACRYKLSERPSGCRTGQMFRQSFPGPGATSQDRLRRGRRAHRSIPGRHRRRAMRLATVPRAPVSSRSLRLARPARLLRIP